MNLVSVIHLTTISCFTYFSDPPIPHIPHVEELRSIIPPPPVDVSTEKECFELWIRIMHLEAYRKAIVTGFISSIGSLTESLVSIRRCHIYFIICIPMMILVALFIFSR